MYYIRDKKKAGKTTDLVTMLMEIAQLRMYDSISSGSGNRKPFLEVLN
jgi:hypothetical protein